MISKQFTIQKQDVSVSQNSQKRHKNFVIRKKIAKHGLNSIIVIPKLLQGDLPPKTIVEISIRVIEEAKIEDKINVVEEEK